MCWLPRVQRTETTPKFVPHGWLFANFCIGIAEIFRHTSPVLEAIALSLFQSAGAMQLLHRTLSPRTFVGNCGPPSADHHPRRNQPDLLRHRSTFVFDACVIRNASLHTADPRLRQATRKPRFVWQSQIADRVLQARSRRGNVYDEVLSCGDDDRSGEISGSVETEKMQSSPRIIRSARASCLCMSLRGLLRRSLAATEVEGDLPP